MSLILYNSVQNRTEPGDLLMGPVLHLAQGMVQSLQAIYKGSKI